MISALERRERILELVSEKRRITICELALEFGVSEKTIRRDVNKLSCSVPIHTVQGVHGGVVADHGWYAGTRYLNAKQETLLLRILPTLIPEDQPIMQSIIMTFAFPKLI